MSKSAPDAVKSFPLLLGEELRAVVGPGEDKELGGATYLVFTSLRVVFRVKHGWSGFKTHPLVDLRDLRTLSITPSWWTGGSSQKGWLASSRARVMLALQVDGHPPFTFVWPRPGEHRDTCLTLDESRSWALQTPTKVWWSALVDAEQARATWRGDAGGYPGSILDAILLEPGEQAIDCLFGWLNISGTGTQVGGLLLTDARCILFVRGATSWLQPEVTAGGELGMQISDDGAYRYLKSWPLDVVNKATVAYDGSIPYLAIDDGRMVPVPGDTQTKEKRARAFVDALRREREKFNPVRLQAVHPLTCGKCGSPYDSRDVYCSACGFARSTG
jgi:hypothetical protein